MALSILVRRTVLGRVPLTKPFPTIYSRTLMTLPSFSLEGKTCAVTGAARGLGKEILTAFSLSGAKGACIDLSLSSGQQSIAHIKSHISSSSPLKSSEPSYEPELRAYACDVTSESQVQETFQSIIKDFGKLDVLVTAAGIVENWEAEKYPYERWKKMLDINLNGSFLCAKEAGKYWIKEEMRGNLIFVGSMSGLICVRPQKQSAYNASKAAVHLLSNSLATEWGPKGIRVNSLSPGYIKTDLIKDLLKREGRHLEENWVKDIPLGRLAHPSEFQGTAVWMASEASSYLNGSNIVSPRRFSQSTQLLMVGIAVIESQYEKWGFDGGILGMIDWGWCLETMDWISVVFGALGGKGG
ncbi:hypothetical protein HYFRA_00005633 [Hymenoscyphus fraxineus]|uniref:NAD(P)-binding protein n=1 Tax=Hymenoscyphus fraxineus TaxID=746836 RepID=A0A9N9PGK0_9HELO|nr:hypothetical protein HYFRA_00005633 [Hymenoscyphus fraxineus]